MIFWAGHLAEPPLIAILRGVQPEEVLAIGHALYEAGFRIIEIPLNSPQPLVSIQKLAEVFRDRALIGAGTVMAPVEVDRVAAAGGRLIVMPHSNPEIYTAAGASGFGLGSSLYQPGLSAAQVGERAAEIIAAWKVIGTQ